MKEMQQGYERCIVITLLLFAGIANLSAATISQNLYLNRGTFIAVDNATFPGYAFNGTALFDQENFFIELTAGDSLLLWVHNTDTVQHSFRVKDMLAAQTIPAGDSVIIALHFPAVGTYIYYDAEDYPKFAYLGAAGLIGVQPANSLPDGIIPWNLKEYDSQWNIDLDAGQPVNWSNYHPDYFTINSRSSGANMMGDTLEHLSGHLRDTLLIFVGNTGRGAHSLHFHGFHLEIIAASESPSYIGRIKDTFLVKPMQTLILLLVPNQLGMYPMHDHNLLSVTGGGYYPKGMLLMMEIHP